jgi:hypothetical protein
MAETFELEGTVISLEQKRYRSGGGLIPGFWSVKLQTAQGERSCSFNSTRRKDPGDPSSETVPHPDFEIVQRAQATGESIRIRGHLTHKGEGPDRRTFKNGTSAELVGSASTTQWGTVAAGAATKSRSAGEEADIDDAKWAVGLVVDDMDLERPPSDEEMSEIKETAEKLVSTARDVADDAGSGRGRAT